MSSRALRIKHVLQTLEDLNHYEIENESDQHAGPPGRESHFKLLVVSGAFRGLNRIDRQRKIHDLLKSELSSGLHALSLKLVTPEEWNKTQVVFESPQCASQVKKGV